MLSRFATVGKLLGFALAASPVAAQDLDACGVLQQGSGGCTVFEGGGGTYVLAEVPNRYQFGDTVRVVGTIDENCITICNEVDGCIRGAEVYDPAVFPCGQPLPSFPGDILAGLCTGISGALTAGAVLGLWLTRGRPRPCA